MLFYVLAAFAVALVLAFFGVIGTIGVSISSAQILIALFLTVLVLSLIAGFVRR